MGSCQADPGNSRLSEMDSDMALHFDRQEFDRRRQAVTKAMTTRGLDALLIFRQESMYYLTGYDSFGYCFFQCLVLTSDGRMVLLTRAPDLRQAQQTSILDDIRIWTDGDGANPTTMVTDILAELGWEDGCLGIELDAPGLTAAHWLQLERALDAAAQQVDASDLITGLRMVKSPAELAYVREAASLGDLALDEAVKHATPGAFEGDILAAMQGAVFRGGGDYPGNPFIIGSGQGALLCRYFSGRRKLDANDQLTLEFAGVYRQYHSALMRTILVGRPEPAQVDMHAVCRDALEACLEEVRPGRTAGDIYAAHARVFDDAGYREHRMNACGYSLGAVYAPCWMDKPMFYADNPTVLQPGMVLFLHMILMNSDAGQAMTLGTTVAVDESGWSPLSRAPLDLIVTG